MELNKITIYKITSSSCKLIYIGQTSRNIKHRFSMHKSHLNKCRSRFIFENSTERSDVIIEELCSTKSHEEADKIERFYIENTKNTCNKKINLCGDDKKQRMKLASKKWIDAHRPEWLAYMRKRYSEGKIKIKNTIKFV